MIYVVKSGKTYLTAAIWRQAGYDTWTERLIDREEYLEKSKAQHAARCFGGAVVSIKTASVKQTALSALTDRDRRLVLELVWTLMDARRITTTKSKPTEITMAQAATRLGVHKSTIIQAVARGHIRSRTAGDKKKMLDVESVDAYVVNRQMSKSARRARARIRREQA